VPAVIRAFICDDDAETRDALQMALADEEDLELAGEADNGSDGLAGIRDLQPDVVILDLNMPQMDGLEVLAGIRTAAPGARTVIFTGFPEDQARTIALRLGATHFLEKGSPLGEVVAAVREAGGEGPSSPVGDAT
jgi:DNA-binding NarL/FixJ family response regulator